MNKNTIIGLVLIGLILFGFSWYNQSKYNEQRIAQQKEQAIQDSLAKIFAAQNPTTDSLSVPDSLSAAQQTAALSQPQDSTPLALAALGDETFTTLENKVLRLTFSNKGGRVAAVQLKDYKRLYDKYSGDSLMLFNTDGSSFGLKFYTANQEINTADLHFKLQNLTDNAIVYRLYADSTSYLEYIYTIAPDDYMIDFRVDVSHFKNTIYKNRRDLAFAWNVVSPQEEKGFKNENQYTTIAYKYPSDDAIEELSISTGEEKQNVTTSVQWTAFKQQFFSSIFIAKNNFATADLSYKTFKPEENNIKDFNALLTVAYDPATSSVYDFNFYFGPNKYSTMAAYEGLDLQKLVPLGWGIIGWVNRFVIIPVFDFLGGYFASYGLIIFLLTIFIKIVILPLTYKSYLSTAKMRLLKPELDEINKKYPKKEDAMKKQQAMMGLYKSAGVSPMGGCLPLLIQMPILFAMFKFFPSSIELRGQSFLWADDLSSYDSIWTFPGNFSIPFYGDHISLFTLLMAISLYLTSKINMNQQPGGQQMPGMKFMMLYMMPIMLLFFFNDSSSGLSYYYLLSNVISLLQMYLMRFIVSDAKLHARMKATAAKPQKKSKWQQRLEDMQKQAAEQQRQKGNKR